MDLREWLPLYAEIREEFGYSEEEDRQAAGELDRLLAGRPKPSLAPLEALRGAEVSLCGDGPELISALDAAPPKGPVLAADGAVERLGDQDVPIAAIFTDLDGPIAPQRVCNEAGTLMVVHAHGDNRQVIAAEVPRLSGPLLGSTQTEPFGRLVNFGGFTDGDRAVCAARRFGASTLHLYGFQFDDPSPKAGRSREEKLRKLAWARRIIIDHNPPSVELRFH